MVVNSHPLYRLSYWGMKKELFNTVGAPSQYFIELEYFKLRFFGMPSLLDGAILLHDRIFPVERFIKTL
jgi:hypothetical protein